MPTRRPRFTQLISVILLALVVSLSAACSGSPPPDPTATETITQSPTATQSPTVTQPSQPTQLRTLSPARRTPIPTLNSRQIQATQQAQLGIIRVQIPSPTAPSHLSDSPAPISGTGATADDTTHSAPDHRADTDALGVADVRATSHATVAGVTDPVTPANPVTLAHVWSFRPMCRPRQMI